MGFEFGIVSSVGSICRAAVETLSAIYGQVPTRSMAGRERPVRKKLDVEIESYLMINTDR